ncbi:hypothetical protein A6R68_07721, partial [Neotoma lepida]
KDKIVPDEVSLSVRRSRRISHHPSEWWLVKPEEGSVDRSSSRENESSVVYHNRKKRTKKNQLPKNPGKKTFPSKRQKTESSSRVQKSLNVKGSRGSVSSRDEISGSQSEPLENNEADPTQTKSLDISGPTRGSKYQNSIRTSQNVHLKSHTREYPSKTPMESNLDSDEPKNSIWEERFKDFVMSGTNNSDMSDEKDQESLEDRLVVNLDINLGDPFQATLAKDPETREIVPMDLIRPRDTYQFFVEQHGLKVFKTLDTAVFSTGKLVLGPHEEKGKQHVGQDILVSIFLYLFLFF